MGARLGDGCWTLVFLSLLPLKAQEKVFFKKTVLENRSMGPLCRRNRGERGTVNGEWSGGQAFRAKLAAQGTEELKAACWS